MKAVVYINDDATSRTALVCDSAIQRCKDPFFVPDGGAWFASVMRGVRIDRLGKNIGRKFADRYYTECVTAVHPFDIDGPNDPVDRWGRDGALVVSNGAPVDAMAATAKNAIDEKIELCSRNMTLKTGDIILVDTDRKFEIPHASANFDIEAENGFPELRFKVR